MDIKNYITSGIIELYVMGMCTKEEEKELEQLRLQYSELDNAVLQYEKDLEAVMQKSITLPPAHIDEKILKSLDRMQTPVINMNPHQRLSSFGWLKAVAAAAIILLLGSSFFNYTLYKKTKQQEQVLLAATETEATLPASDYSVLNNPAITPVAMYGVGVHSLCRCTMFWDKKTGTVYVMLHHLIKSTAGQSYQLWAQVDGKPVSVGLINDEIRGKFIELPNVPEGSVAFSVTLEKAGGNTQPSVEETYLSGRI